MFFFLERQCGIRSQKSNFFVIFGFSNFSTSFETQNLNRRSNGAVILRLKHFLNYFQTNNYSNLNTMI